MGFTPKELHEYFAECLEKEKVVNTLIDRIDENPAIASSCYLPMIASILVHLFESGNNALPATQYGIFSELVLSCIYRHLNERTQQRDLTLESLQQIPEPIKEPFLFLCKLAYKEVMENKIIFSDLPADVNTLGLLQGVKSFVGRGKAVYFNFLHLSIQEILAGFYMATQLSDNEQVSKFNELFDKPRFSAVFQFYAAITKLRRPEIKEIVIKIAKKSNKTLLLSLLHCLYEAQDPSPCESVVQQLTSGLNLIGTTLSPSDYLCIGYFLSNASARRTATHNDTLKVHLAGCSIRDQGYFHHCKVQF